MRQMTIAGLITFCNQQPQLRRTPMHLRLFCRALLWLVAGVMPWLQPSETGAASLTVNEGYDLFATQAGTSYPGLGQLMGVPLGTFDFGAGPVPVGNTDTIEHRLDDVSVLQVGDTGTTRLEMLALQLETVAPVDFGGNGLDNYFITLQSSRGGPATIGSMDITFLSTAGGTFTSFFDVFFDIRKGSLSGVIVFSDELRATNQGDGWTRIPPPNAVTIPGVNLHLNGTDNDNDFWPATPFQYGYPNGAAQVLATSTVPEPGTFVLLAMALAGVMAIRRRRA